MSEQEHSIEVRSSELFFEDTPAAPTRATKPFAVFLRETPAQPLSPGLRALLWAIGIIGGVLFLVAVWRVSQRHLKKTPTDEAPANAAVSTARRDPGGGFPRT
jgi:hypothetical protein